MRKIFKWILFFISIILIAVIWISFHHPYVNVHDDFEASELNKLWSTNRMADSSFKVQSDIIRNGKSALKITLKNGDIVEAATFKDKASERDELMETMPLYALEGKTYEYKFSMFLPDSFPILPTRLVIAQWKEFCPFCSCSEYSPIVAVRYVSGRLFITLQTDTLRKTLLYELKEDIRNRWLDFTFQIRFSQQRNGMIKAFLNQKEIITYAGITSYQNNCLVLSDKNKYYFKMGLYRDRIPESMSIYIDDYSKRQLD
jgi:hypothetical protein